jgi:DNA-binding IscR family transcriptional regulator
MTTSVKADYALRAILDLASQKPGEPVKIADIARRRKIPQKFLELILVGLKQAGFVESRRGAEVIRSVDGPPEGTGRGRSKTETPFTDMWDRVDLAVAAIIDHTSIGELLRDWAERQSKGVLNWEI